MLTQIKSKSYVKSQGGIVRVSGISQDGIEPSPYHIIIGLFPKSAATTDIYLMAFFSKPYSKCYKYVANYASDKFKKSLISKFDNPGSGLKREGQTLKWKDPIKKYEIAMLTTSRINGAGNAVETTAFKLEIRKSEEKN